MFTGNVDRPLVSVLIPVYNGENYINRSVNSILNQTYTNLEILVLDDGSNDGTSEFVRSLDDDRVKLIRFESNTKKVGIVNYALGIIRGEYVVFQDVDDFSFESRIGNLLDFLLNNSGVGVVFSGYLINGKILDFNKHWRRAHEQFMGEFSNNVGDLMVSEKFHPTAFPTAMFRSELLKYVPGYSQVLAGKMGEDLEFYFMIGQNTKLAGITDCLYDYTFGRSGSITESRTKGVNSNYDIEYVKFCLRYYLRVGRNPLREFLTDEVAVFELSFARTYIENLEINAHNIEIKYQESLSYKIGYFIVRPLYWMGKLFMRKSL
jgi:glycosyltransferase involved in cell wall biosynthesis